MISLYAVCIGCVLDLLLGDPLWLPHPVVLMGRCISLMERVLRRRFPNTSRGQMAAGAVMALVLPTISFALSAALLWGCGRISPYLRLAAEGIMCYQILAARCLQIESMKVYRCVRAGDLDAARTAVSRIVGRDTDRLSLEGVIKAAVETVAENTSDGVIAPLLCLAIGGAPLGFFYKAVNTMDSMVGYKNDRYLWFGCVPAKLDDVCNYLPARISGVGMALSAFLCGLDGKNAFRIFHRDRYNHSSPNSAQTESACAGALGVQLAGDAYYFGILHRKKTIGDALRPVEVQDIVRANRLMYLTALICLILFLGARLAVLAAMGGIKWSL